MLLWTLRPRRTSVRNIVLVALLFVIPADRFTLRCVVLLNSQVLFRVMSLAHGELRPRTQQDFKPGQLRPAKDGKDVSGRRAVGPSALSTVQLAPVESTDPTVLGPHVIMRPCLTRPHIKQQPRSATGFKSASDFKARRGAFSTSRSASIDTIAAGVTNTIVAHKLIVDDELASSIALVRGPELAEGEASASFALTPYQASLLDTDARAGNAALPAAARAASLLTSELVLNDADGPHVAERTDYRLVHPEDVTRRIASAAKMIAANEARTDAFLESLHEPLETAVAKAAAAKVEAKAASRVGNASSIASRRANVAHNLSAADTVGWDRLRKRLKTAGERLQFAPTKRGSAFHATPRFLLPLSASLHLSPPLSASLRLSCSLSLFLSCSLALLLSLARP